MTEKELMGMALAEAQKSSEPLQCGCVIAKHGEVLAAAYNSQRIDHDATAHAEIKAIAQAGKKLGQKNLTGCVAYCSCEPCTMCLSAMVFAKIEKVYFTTPLASISTNIFQITSEEVLQKAPHKLELIRWDQSF